ncbi:hypothetical protein EGN72_03255 [Pseudorhodobacter sp. E13]|nr:hypothetical protein EGN72_03255 [Pseudorhodobacter sp. E13]
MSASWDGHHDARNDAEFDVAFDLPRQPRPRFLKSLMSTQYRVAYMAAYRQTYNHALRRHEDGIAYELSCRSKLIPGEQVPRGRVFERGWRDGFDGKDSIPDGYSHTEVETYERGHSVGKQYRELELTQQSRQRSRHLLSP